MVNEASPPLPLTETKLLLMNLDGTGQAEFQGFVATGASDELVLCGLVPCVVEVADKLVESATRALAVAVPENVVNAPMSPGFPTVKPDMVDVKSPIVVVRAKISTYSGSSSILAKVFNRRLGLKCGKHVANEIMMAAIGRYCWDFILKQAIENV